MTAAPMSPPQTSTQSIPYPEPDAQQLVRDEIEKIFARYENNPGQTYERLTAEERNLLEINTQKLIDTDASQAQQILTSWLSKDPYDAQAMYLMAETHFKEGNYKKALDLLLALKHYPQILVPEDKIQTLIDTVSIEFTEKLKSNKQFSKLLGVYQRLITAMPDQSRYYYQQAQAQIQLNLYEEALGSLGHVLNDAVWGKLAQELAIEIQTKLDLKDEIQVPLEKEGDQFVVNAVVNGVAGIRLLLDTGASICVLQPQAAIQVGLSPEGEQDILVSLASGTTNAPSLVVDSIEIGAASLDNVLTSILEMPPGNNVDGLLGMNFLGRFKFFIDQNTSTLYLGAR